MRLVTWAVRLLVFLLLVAFAAKNVEPVKLRFYFDMELEAPLVVALFAAFVAGAFFGVLSLVGTLLRQKREAAALKRKLAVDGVEEATLPPPGL
jgi:uncharacterized integral membrane protein